MSDQLSRRHFLAASALTGASLLLPERLLTVGAASRRYVYCPILMYHYVSTPPEDADRYRLDLSVTPEQFAEQVAYFRGAGFTGVTMAQLVAALFDGADFPERPVIFTFDDGYADAYQYAAPILADQGMVGVFFVVTSFVEQPGYLTWRQVIAMRDAGMEIGSHSATHPDLSTLDRARQLEEIESAAATLEAALGTRPAFFCHPLGRYTRTTLRLLKQTGHLAAVTTADGTMQYSRYPYTMKRVRVRGSTTLNELGWLVNREAW